MRDDETFHSPLLLNFYPFLHSTSYYVVCSAYILGSSVFGLISFPAFRRIFMYTSSWKPCMLHITYRVDQQFDFPDDKMDPNTFSSLFIYFYDSVNACLVGPLKSPRLPNLHDFSNPWLKFSQLLKLISYLGVFFSKYIFWNMCQTNSVFCSKLNSGVCHSKKPTNKTFDCIFDRF